MNVKINNNDEETFLNVRDSMKNSFNVPLFVEEIQNITKFYLKRG